MWVSFLLGGVLFYSMCKGSAWAPAFAGVHASGRAVQHFDEEKGKKVVAVRFDIIIEL